MDTKPLDTEREKELASFIANSLLDSEDLDYFEKFQASNSDRTLELFLLLFLVSNYGSPEDFISALPAEKFTEAVEELAAKALVKQAMDGLFANGTSRDLDQVNSDILRFFEATFLHPEESLLLVESIDDYDKRCNAKLALIVAKVFDLELEELDESRIDAKEYNTVATVAILKGLENKTLKVMK